MHVRRIAIALALIAFVVVGAQLAHAAPPPDAANNEPRSISKIRKDVRDGLRAEAISRRQGDSRRQALQLVTLYREMANHPLRDTSGELKRLGIQVRARLRTVRDQAEDGANAVASRQKLKDAAKTSPASRVLAQQLPPPNGANAGQRGAAGTTTAPRQTADYGEDLVELIQATISPAKWDINGGAGAIVYYSPLRVLVVRAPSDIHGQIGGAVRQLRATP